jgi:hypothetical protein
MRSESSLVAVAATAVAAVGLVAAVYLTPDLAHAADATTRASTTERGPASPDKAAPRSTAPDGKSGAACTCPPANKEKLWHRPKFAELRSFLDEADETAALESVQLALSEVGDGSTYVWHRHNGRLSGIVQPTASFKNAGGSVCRHIVVMLTSGPDTKKTEGIACRLADGRWQLEG